MTEERPQPSYNQEIAQIMHAFGDNCQPRADSVCLMQSIIQDQMMKYLVIVTDVAKRFDRGKDFTFTPDMLIFTLRKNVTLMQHLYNHAKFKMMKESITAPIKEMNDESTERAQSQSVMAIIENLDEVGEYTDAGQIDVLKTERNIRADKISLLLSGVKYDNWCKARRACFFKRGKDHFKQWLGIADVKISDAAVGILMFLCRELVVCLTDLTLIVRADKKLTGLGTDIYGAGKVLQFFEPHILPGEILETLRRLQSAQIGCVFLQNHLYRRSIFTTLR